MNIKEFDKELNEILEQETKKLIMEQIDDVDHLIDSVKNFQTLSGLLSNVTEIEDAGADGIMVFINIKNVQPEKLVDCCGGTSLEEAVKNLMQGLHHDLEDNKFGSDWDVDIDTSGDENALNLAIRLTPGNDLVKNNDMEENIKDTNPTADDKKDIILGSKEMNEQNNKPNLKKQNMKKTITLSENGMKKLLKKIIKEIAEPTMDTTTEKAISDSGKENADYIAYVEKKIKDYLSFKGNDNPEFPHQIGQGEEKAARQNSTEQEEEVDLNRGRGPQDLDYDTDGINDNGEPGKKFTDRAEKALVGDSTMGNSQDAVGITKSDTGKNILKSMKKRREALRKEPIYPKEAVPVDTKPSPNLGRPVNESVEEDIKKMKKFAAYNDKTQ